MTEQKELISPEFTGKLKITKSLKISMVPVGETERWIKEHSVFEKDKELFDKNLKARPILDEYIKRSVNEALKDIPFDFDEYHKSRKDRKLARDMEKELNETLVKKVLKAMDGIRKTDDIDSADFVKTILRKFAATTDIPGLSRAEAVDCVDAAAKLTALNGKFNISRISIIETTMPKRVLENFDIYVGNMDRIRKIYESGEFDFLFERYPEALLFVEAANYGLVCSPEGIETYNRVINGYGDSIENWTKGFNQEINEANQRNKNSNARTTRYPLLKVLYKQILFEERKAFSIAGISTDDEVKSLIRSVNEDTEEACRNAINYFAAADPKTLYVKGSYLHTLSAILYGGSDPYTLTERVKEAEESRIKAEYDALPKKTKAVTSKYNAAMQNISKAINEKIFSMDEIDAYCYDLKDMLSVCDVLTAKMQELYDSVYGEDGSWKKVEEEKALEDGTKIWKAKNGSVARTVNDYLTGIIEIRKFIRPFAQPLDDLKETDRDTSQAADAETICETLYAAVRAQKLVHAYLTRKDADIAVSTPVYMGGTAKANTSWWNNETGNIQNKDCALARKDGKYYFIGTFDNKGSYNIVTAAEGEDYYEFLDIKKGQDANKQIKKVLFSNKAIRAHFSESTDDFVIGTKVKEPITIRKNIYDKYQAGEFRETSRKIRMGEDISDEERGTYGEYMNALYQMSKNYTEYSRFRMDTLLPLEAYETENDLLDDVNTKTLDYRWVKISAACVDEGVRNGDIYMFMAKTYSMYSNKENKRGYTGLFLDLVSENILVNHGMTLNAGITIYYRNKVHDPITVHKKGDVLVNKFTEDRERIPGESYKAIFAFYNGRKTLDELTDEDRQWLEKATTKVCTGEIIKDRRYTMDQYSISISYNINRDVNNRKRADITSLINETVGCGNILSVTRGTRDLVYYTVVDNAGNVLESRSLNVINGVDYAKMLAQISSERHESNAAFDVPKRVAMIKTAYCSFAVHEVINAAIRHNALIVTELISKTFKDKHSLLDNQLFEKFENALKNSLMSVRIKGATGTQPGSRANPLQLCNAGDKSLRNGILYQIPSSYTNICPITGYADIIDYYNIVSVGDIRAFFERFTNISYNGEKQRFEFTFNIEDMPIKLETYPDKTDWTVYGRGEITTYDTLIKANRYVFDVAQLLADMISGEGLDPEQNIVGQMDRLSGNTLKKMYRIFRDISRGVVAECREVPVAYYKSPVVDEGDMEDRSILDKSLSEIRCLNLDEKTRYYLALSKEAEDAGTKPRYVAPTSIEWLNYIQSKKER